MPPLLFVIYSILKLNADLRRALAFIHFKTKQFAKWAKKLTPWIINGYNLLFCPSCKINPVFCPGCKIHQGAFVNFWPRGFCLQGLSSISLYVYAQIAWSVDVLVNSVSLGWHSAVTHIEVIIDIFYAPVWVSTACWTGRGASCVGPGRRSGGTAGCTARAGWSLRTRWLRGSPARTGSPLVYALWHTSWGGL